MKMLDLSRFSRHQAQEYRNRKRDFGGPPEGLDMENRLARMLRPQPGQMSNPFSLVNLGQPMMSGQPATTAQIPRGDVLPRGFPFFYSLREFFHRQVGTPSRPLRGGKEGPACRVM